MSSLPTSPCEKILFVCMGNICRSPAAEAVMRHTLTQAGLAQHVTVDSAGTIDMHVGNLSDPRTRRTALARGIQIDHRARQVTPQDLADFDLVLVMDQSNLANVRKLDPQGTYADKIRLFCDYCQEHDHEEVPDPYYGGADGFELVLDLLQDGCRHLTTQLAQQQQRGK